MIVGREGSKADDMTSGVGGRYSTHEADKKKGK